MNGKLTMSKRVELIAPFRIPRVCCVCLQPAEASIEARHSRFIPLGPAVHVSSSQIGIPFCAFHVGRTRTRMRLCKLAMIVCLVLSAFVFMAFQDQIDNHPIVLVLFFLLFGLAIFFGFYERAQIPVRLRAAKSEKEKIIGSSPLARVVLECRSAEFALAVVQANKGVQQPDEPHGL